MAHRYRLYPDAGQEKIMIRHCRDARFIWNLALEQCAHARILRQYADQNEWGRELTKARANTPWLAEGSSSVQQAALQDLHQAFINWWKNPGHFGHPTWRKLRVNEGFRISYLRTKKINRKWAEIAVPKLGYVKFRLSRAIPQEIKSARITLDRSGRWHVSFTAPQPMVKRDTTGAVVGLDMGIIHTVTTSNSEHLDMPELLTLNEASRKTRLQRKIIKQQKGSNRRSRTRAKIARIYAKETDRKKDWIEKTTTQLVRHHDLIVIEKLDVIKMTKSAKGTVDNPGISVAKKRNLNRKIQDQSWGLFRTRLEDKAKAATEKCLVIAINPAFTSQRCFICGYTAPENRDSQAVFRCQVCGYESNADINAAKNILAAGYAVTGRGGLPLKGSDEASIARIYNSEASVLEDWVNTNSQVSFVQPCSISESNAVL